MFFYFHLIKLKFQQYNTYTLFQIDILELF